MNANDTLTAVEDVLPCRSFDSSQSTYTETRFPVHLWLFNHPFQAITEQVECFCNSLRDHGYRTTVSRYPAPRALNVVIENFSQEANERITSFCDAHGKRVAVILTEHLDLKSGELFFHGKPIIETDDYMASATKKSRAINLLLLRNRISCFLRLGDLPRLHRLDEVLPGIPVRSIPFPTVVPTDRTLNGQSFTHDFVFTGVLTQYRRKVLSLISKSFTVYAPDSDRSEAFVSRRRRDAINAMARLVLNIPQYSGWQWISPMRVLAALRCGRATMTLRTPAQTAIDAVCLGVDSPDEWDLCTVRNALANAKDCFEQKYAIYSRFVCSGANAEFPHSDFHLWGRIEL
jgi:hypothetical protein